MIYFYKIKLLKASYQRNIADFSAMTLCALQAIHRSQSFFCLVLFGINLYLQLMLCPTTTQQRRTRAQSQGLCAIG